MQQKKAIWIKTFINKMRLKMAVEIFILYNYNKINILLIQNAKIQYCKKYICKLVNLIVR